MSNYQELLKQNYNFIKKIDEINKNIINLKDKNDYKKIIKQIEKLEEEIQNKEEETTEFIDLFNECYDEKNTTTIPTNDILLLNVYLNIKNSSIELSLCKQNLETANNKIKIEKETEIIQDKIEKFKNETLGQIISIMGILIAIISIIITTLNGSNEALLVYIQDCITNNKPLLNNDFYMTLVATPAIIIIFSIAFLLIISGLIFGDHTTKEIIGGIILLIISTIMGFILLDHNIFLSIIFFLITGGILILLESRIIKQKK